MQRKAFARTNSYADSFRISSKIGRAKHNFCVAPKYSNLHTLITDIYCHNRLRSTQVTFTFCSVFPPPPTEYGGSYNSGSANKKSSGSGPSSKLKSDYGGTASAFVQPIPFKKLSYILDQTSLNIFLDIIQTDSGFLETLNRSNSSTEIVILTIRTILKMIETPFTEFVRVFLEQVRSANNYWKQIESILKDTTAAPHAPSASAKQKKKGAKIVLHKNDQEIWQHVYNLCVGVTRHITLPGQFAKNVRALIESNKNGNLQLAPFQAYFDTLIEPKPTDDQVVASEQNGTIGREWDIYPTMEELLGQGRESYVKANVVKGRFNSVEHYQSVQLSLLREDFIAPLRDGICEVIKKSKKDESVADVELQSNFNVRVYSTVRIMIRDRERFDKSNFRSEHLLVDLEPKTRKESANHQLDGSSAFNSGKYAKKLMFGSLLCFSSSTKFDDLIIAIVSNRDVEMLNLGFVSMRRFNRVPCETNKNFPVRSQIQIEIVRSYNVTQLFDRDFIMFESEVYFESYRHVHHVLKSFTDETFPLRQYIINVDVSHFAWNQRSNILTFKLSCRLHRSIPATCRPRDVLPSHTSSTRWT